MTREEAIKVLENTPIPPMGGYSFNDISDALYMAIEALEREPSDDLISRADAIRVVEKNSYRMAGLTEVKLKYEIAALPSADRPKGEWVSRSGCYGVAYCSECDYELRVNNTNFCPNCGSDMRGNND